MAQSLLEYTGPGSIPGRFVEAIHSMIGVDTLTTLDPVQTPDLERLLKESHRVYRAEPTRLWDSTLDDTQIDQDWSTGEKALTDLRSTGWEPTDTEATFYHHEGTLTYEARVTVTDGETDEQLFYVGDLAYDIDEDRAPSYLQEDPDSIDPDTVYDRLENDIEASQHVLGPADTPPQYRDGEGSETLDAYLEDIDIHEAEHRSFEDGQRLTFHGEHREYGQTIVIASTHH